MHYKLWIIRWLSIFLHALWQIFFHFPHVKWRNVFKFCMCVVSLWRAINTDYYFLSILYSLLISINSLGSESSTGRQTNEANATVNCTSCTILFFIFHSFIVFVLTMEMISNLPLCWLTNQLVKNNHATPNVTIKNKTIRKRVLKLVC